MSRRNDKDLVHAVRRNGWTLTYLAVVGTALLILLTLEVWGTYHA